ncbi:hypothetical protein KY348_03745 [Candidatus Woesearchaeota archaeon]|nr:hypothetical protein [Candidatus Woesearchaeota archaeon]
MRTMESKKKNKKDNLTIKNTTIKSFFKFSKRKLLIFIILFYVLFFYLPVIKCIPDHDVKEKFCEKYGLCKVDIYSSISTVISGYDAETNTFLCPATRITSVKMILLILIFMLGTYIITCILDYYYARFRDK